ncbi:hypothetical protein M0D69_13820 [Caballeronia sp. SEWSISQ10-4 2]|uniref:hypothetical protein n=1 Tax=Caballeronia sp. SEWSISQ10-4 2 TaxID=2937438 RepID=UPI00264CC2D9|nr:hypothetical protein [Caballeronia sp. SEWSISQ10-4 2]MDN7179071.1 hypothetical protein [Caballeronia sp. SEWSISQ10-4 2]
MSERKFKGVWIPAEMWLDRSLSITEKVMLVEIDSLDAGPRGCYASNAHFAEFFGLSISRVSEIINGLAKRALIAIEQVSDGKRVIERRIKMVNVPLRKTEDPFGKHEDPLRKTEDPPSEKAKGSNTSLSKPMSSKNPSGYSPEFEEIWAAYPNRAGGNSKADAFKAVEARIKAGVLPADMLEGAKRYAKFCDATDKTGTEYVKQAATFFGPGLHFDADWTAPAKVTPKSGRPSINSFEDTTDYTDLFDGTHTRKKPNEHE